MKITAPYGYDDIVPLKKTHRVLLPAAGELPVFARRLNALALSLAEFVVAARDYPIVFASLDRGRSFAPVIVLGLSQGENLFLDHMGEWDRHAYVPAFLRRYPFCISKLYVDGEAKSERVVCVAKSHIDDAGEALFDESGTPAPRWKTAERLLSEFEADLDRTAEMCAALARMRLLQGFTIQLDVGQAEPVKLSGIYRVSEARLRDLKPASHKMLVNKGFMGLIYAHLHSHENFRRLLDRRQDAGRG
jgi:hypothetical protein